MYKIKIAVPDQERPTENGPRRRVKEMVRWYSVEDLEDGSWRSEDARWFGPETSEPSGTPLAS